MKNSTPIFISFFIVSLSFFLSSCTLQKRQHLPGYSVEWNQKQSKVDRTSIARKKTKDKTDCGSVTSVNEGLLILSSDTSEATFQPSKYLKNEIQKLGENLSKVLLSRKKDSCDVIITKEWEFVYVRVVEVRDNTVRFRMCSDPDSEIKIISKSSLSMIKFRNGQKLVFEEKEQKANDETNTTNDLRYRRYTRFEKLGLSGFILTLASLPIWWLLFWPFGFVAGILGIVFGIISMIRISRHKADLKGLGFAVVSLIVGLLIVIITAALWSVLIVLL